MQTEKLLINKGEYLFSKETPKGNLRVKLTVYYQKQKYKWKWQEYTLRDASVTNFVDYIEDFAKRMIESKATRNFYK